MSIIEKVTFAIAVIGFLLSVYNFVKSIIAESARIRISVKYAHKISGFVIMVVEITNKSRLGISITSGEIIDSAKNEIQFGETSKVVFSYNHPDLSGKSAEKTSTFPIHVEPLRSIRVFIQTEDWNPSLPLDCKIRLGSSRGWISTNVTLPDDCGNLLSLLQHIG